MNLRNRLPKYGSLLVWLSVVLLPPVFAQPGGAGWLPGWAEELGLELENAPSPVDKFLLLKGRIVDVEKARVYWGEVSEGAEVELKFAGNVAWTVETDSGTIRPCVLRANLTGSEKTVTLLPDRKTHQLRLGPPPFKGSTRVNPQGTN